MKFIHIYIMYMSTTHQATLMPAVPDAALLKNTSTVNSLVMVFRGVVIIISRYIINQRIIIK